MTELKASASCSTIGGAMNGNVWFPSKCNDSSANWSQKSHYLERLGQFGTFSPLRRRNLVLWSACSPSSFRLNNSKLPTKPPSTRFGKLQCFGINVLLLGQCNLLISIVSFHFASLNMQETHTSLMVPYSETVHLGDNIASETISPSGARCLAGWAKFEWRCAQQANQLIKFF